LAEEKQGDAKQGASQTQQSQQSQKSQSQQQGGQSKAAAAGEQEVAQVYPATIETPQSKPYNIGGAPGGEAGDGEPPTGDRAPASVLALHETLAETNADQANIRAPEFNPTTPDGSAPPNNLPGPHGPQGVEHLQQDPRES
jgi:hypothetical protein